MSLVDLFLSLTAALGILLGCTTLNDRIENCLRAVQGGYERSALWK